MNLKTALRIVPLLLVMAFALPMRAGTLDPSVIGMFPKNVREFAYADLSQARQFPWFAQLQQQVLPPRFANLEQLLTSAGIDPSSQIKEVVWAVAPLDTKTGKPNAPLLAADGMVGVALGDFDTESVETFFKSRKLRTVDAGGYTLYSASSGVGTGDLFLAVIDSSTIAFGPRNLLERLITVHYGGEESLLSNAAMLPLINQANGDSVFWGVFDPAASRLVILHLVPDMGRFPQAGNMIARMRALLVTMRASTGLDAEFHAISGSPQDAVALSQLVQAGVLVRQYQASQTNPALARILGAISVAPSGSQLNISLALTNDQIIALIQRNLFVE
ncbi:MAG: hypothetical protein ACYDDI_08005 [Candidatus Acidiferrales bacterium]